MQQEAVTMSDLTPGYNLNQGGLSPSIKILQDKASQGPFESKHESKVESNPPKLGTNDGRKEVKSKIFEMPIREEVNATNTEQVVPKPTEPIKERSIDLNKENDEYKRLKSENLILKQEISNLQEEIRKVERRIYNSIHQQGFDDEEEIEAVVDQFGSQPHTGIMPKECYNRIQQHLDFLREDLDPKHLLKSLLLRHVISKDDVGTLKSALHSRGRRACAEVLIFVILRCTLSVYKQFLICLEENGYFSAMKKLEPGCEFYEGKIKFSNQKHHFIKNQKSPEYKECVKRFEENIEKLYQTIPGEQIVGVRDLTKGCVEVSFHLISLGGKSNEEELRRVLEDAIKSGKIGDNAVSPEGFSFQKISSDELTEMGLTSQKKQTMDDLEREIGKLEAENIRLKVDLNHTKTENHDLKEEIEKLRRFKEENKKLRAQLADAQRLEEENRKLKERIEQLERK
ncbi:uncharacterized protein LOC126808823 isoform X1 [Patella vulgata]|uniref:uncharacterized protein LOC126808823 isoform X1 n=1 Tax=Patella vulgata TaxID=6465 RepID=UPI00218053A7|nr:uncharacterized protein LOC126808823 isoform X1 [Patella vulgata]